MRVHRHLDKPLRYAALEDAHADLLRTLLSTPMTVIPERSVGKPVGYDVQW